MKTIKNTSNNQTYETPRAGCFDMWNAFMVKDANYTYMNDIPICPCTANTPPLQLISYDDAKALYKKEIKDGNHSFHHNAYCW